MQRWNAAPFAAKGSFTLHSERPRIPPADANILVVNEHNLKVVFGTHRAITHPTQMTFYICGKFQNIDMQVFKFIFQSVGDGALNMRQNVAAQRSFANPAAQGGCSPVLVSHSYPEQVISRNTWGGGGWMITASPLRWFLHHTHSSETCIARNKSLPHYAPSVGLFRAPTLVLAVEDYLFFPEIPLRCRLLVWFAQKEKNLCVLFLK